MDVRTGLFYAKSDEWVRVEGDIAVIGVTDYAQSQLSDIVYFEFSTSRAYVDGLLNNILLGRFFGSNNRQIFGNADFFAFDD